MIDKLKTLQVLLGKEELICTGSTALAYHGLMDFSEAMDLDLCLVNPTAGAKEILDKLQAASPSPKHHAGSPVNYSFIYEGVKVDVWLQDSHTEKEYVYNKDGVKISSIKAIVKAKKSYNRPKDWIQLMQLAGKIFDGNVFHENLSSVKTSLEEYDEVDG